MYRAAWCVLFLFIAFVAGFAQNLQPPSDYSIDIQLGIATRPRMMGGNPEIIGTPANQTGDEVLHRLVSAGFTQPYPWKLTLVNSGAVNASSTAGGQI